MILVGLLRVCSVCLIWIEEDKNVHSKFFQISLNTIIFNSAQVSADSEEMEATSCLWSMALYCLPVLWLLLWTQSLCSLLVLLQSLLLLSNQLPFLQLSFWGHLRPTWGQTRNQSTPLHYTWSPGLMVAITKVGWCPIFLLQSLASSLLTASRSWIYMNFSIEQKIRCLQIILIFQEYACGWQTATRGLNEDYPPSLLHYTTLPIALGVTHCCHMLCYVFCCYVGTMRLFIYTAFALSLSYIYLCIL